MSDLFDLPFEDEPAPPEPGDSEAGAGGAVAPKPGSLHSGEGGRTRRIFTVSELTSAVRELLESEFPEIWVEGEISNGRVWNTGHLYFTLKDQGAQVRAVMF